jgi:hypothetical protein
VKTPSLGAIVLGTIPFVTMCLSVGMWDRIDPMILGLPFNLFWLLMWIVLTSVCLWGAYRLETPSDGGGESRDRNGKLP